MTPPTNPVIVTPAHIVKLLQEDLKNSKLLLGLNQLGIVADPYHSDLGSIILVLMGFNDNNEDLYAFYQQQIEQLTSLETSAFHQQLDSLASNLYEVLSIRSG